MSTEARTSEKRLLRCRCGEVDIPNGWGGVETLGNGGLRKVHYFDKCAEMFVYDEVADIDSEVWDALL